MNANVKAYALRNPLVGIGVMYQNTHNVLTIDMETDPLQQYTKRSRQKRALTEGILTFAVVFVSLGLSWKDPNSFFMKAWISSVTKLALHRLDSNLTGGCDRLGIRSRRSHNQGAFVCVLAGPSRGNFVECVDFHVTCSAPQAILPILWSTSIKW